VVYEREARAVHDERRMVNGQAQRSQSTATAEMVCRDSSDSSDTSKGEHTNYHEFFPPPLSANSGRGSGYGSADSNSTNGHNPESHA